MQPMHHHIPHYPNVTGIPKCTQLTRSIRPISSGSTGTLYALQKPIYLGLGMLYRQTRDCSTVELHFFFIMCVSTEMNTIGA
jgi:hypothetical protein